MRLFLFGTLLWAIAFSPATAHAYIDPGSASLFATLLIGILAGAAVAIRVYWNRLLSFFGRDQNKLQQADEKSEED